MVQDARVEADELRRTARRMLDEARAEVADLSTRRDEIAAELGRLSGVIEALNVVHARGLQRRCQRRGTVGSSGVESGAQDVPR